MQALLCGQSELTVHSALQFGGDPMKLSIQEHIGMLLTVWHKELGPQGDGVQGLV